MLHVMIAGAGLGGMALAQGLRRAGIEVTVFERDATLTARRQGYRLHIDALAHAALRRLLPTENFEFLDATAGLPKPRFTVLDRDSLDAVFVQDSTEPIDLAVDRLLLRQTLLAGIEDRVVFGKQLCDYEIGSDGRITARFADGDTVTGDVLIGADGVNSAVRQQYLPNARVVDTGLRALYGVVPLTAEVRNLLDDNMLGIFTIVPGPERTHLGVAPVEFRESPETAAARLTPTLRPLSTADYLTCSFGARAEWFGLPDTRLLRELDGPALHSIVVAAVANWHPRLRAVVDRIDRSAMFALQIRSAVPIAPWPTTPITLLGDAIHATSPAAGAGACVALRDAANLRDALVEAATNGNLIAALRNYEHQMIDYGFAAVRLGATNGTRFLGQDPLPID
ncbi:NAD(P)-binding protein [Nocardia arthritidis]|uniref:NAD(P)-binding protein n=2 Tax=Nocardia arthritidis TaxID=228602 RepID=A0A6G9YBG6_9NOCA|nr:NAD(P)-binding protein [Nocardia arthritidis]